MLETETIKSIKNKTGVPQKGKKKRKKYIKEGKKYIFVLYNNCH